MVPSVQAKTVLSLEESVKHASFLAANMCVNVHSIGSYSLVIFCCFSCRRTSRSVDKGDVECVEINDALKIYDISKDVLDSSSCRHEATYSSDNMCGVVH